MTASEKNAPVVDILLATYNGERFLAEQIESLFHQNYSNWRILARDDGSTDGTADLLRHYADSAPERFQIVADDLGNLGYVGNFSRLAKLSDADYLAFCDQDDVWLEDKLALCMDEMRRLEDAHGADRPLLVHSDLKIVDERLEELHPSFWHHQQLDPPSEDQLNQLLFRNVATGCAMLLNRPLKDLSMPIPPEAVIHDWWTAQVAAAFGYLGTVPTATILYRQHGANAVGSSPEGRLPLHKRARRFLDRYGDYRARFLKMFDQIEALSDRYDDRLSPGHRELLETALKIPRSNLLRRLFYLGSRRMVPRGTANLLAFVALTSRTT